MNKEMAKEKCEHFDEEVCSKLDCKKDYKYYGKANCYNCIHKIVCHIYETYNDCAEEVKEMGCFDYQPKIPEGSVLLSKKEYEELKNESAAIAKDYQEMAKFYDEKCEELEEQRDRQAYIAEDLIQEKHRWTEQTREEMAKKLLNDIKRDAENSYLFDYLFDDEPHIGRSDFIKILNKSAKQFGVEVD